MNRSIAAAATTSSPNHDRRARDHLATRLPARYVEGSTNLPLRKERQMATIVVFGGTGYTGGNIVREAASRGHQVVSVSRSEPEDPVEGVRYETGAAEQVAGRVVPGADAVVAALSPRGDMSGRLVEVYRGLVQRAAEAGARDVPGGGGRLPGPPAGGAPLLRGGNPP